MASLEDLSKISGVDPTQVTAEINKFPGISVDAAIGNVLSARNRPALPQYALQEPLPLPFPAQPVSFPLQISRHKCSQFAVFPDRASLSIETPATESYSGTKSTQSQVNIETVSTLKTLAAEHVKPMNFCYVSKGGNDSTGDGSAVYPYLTIQKAIDSSASGVTIYIYPGTYAESITFKAGVNLSAPSKFSVYITGNHISSFTGTVVLENIILQASTGVTLTTSGSGSQNIQLISCSSNSGTGDAISAGNTNAASKIYLEDCTVNVSTSGATARCLYSLSTAKGSIIANRTSFKLDNASNVAISLGGAISFTHTSDVITGSVALTNTVSFAIEPVELSYILIMRIIW